MDVYIYPLMGNTSRLRQLRNTRTLTQSDMARLIRVTQSTYAKYEAGKLVPEIGTQARIAAILGTLPEQLWPPVDEPASASK